MPATVSLALFLENEADLASSIFAQLSLRTLAALSACCRATRAAVDSQPEALWAGLAEAEYSGGHPVLRTPCVRAYLRRQHGLRASIATGLHRATLVDYSCQPPGDEELPAPEEALVSPDFTRAAFLCTGKGARPPTLSIQDRSSGAVRFQWQLAAFPAAPQELSMWR